MIILQPEDRRAKESALPPKWTIFDANLHEPPQGVIAALDDLTGWTAEAHELTGTFGVSPACALWGEVGAFVDIATAPKTGTLTLRPPRPITIPAEADLFTLWVTGDMFDWEKKGAQFEVSLSVQSPECAKEFQVIMADFVTWPTYSIRIIKVPESLRHGGTVTGIRLSGFDPVQAHRFGLDRLCAYRDIRPPLSLIPRPKRPLSLPQGQTTGLHTGPGQLSFPTREETILPENFTSDFTTQVEQNGDVFRFRYIGRDTELTYLWSPKQDPLRVAVQMNGHHVADALAESGWGAAGSAKWFSGDFKGTHADDEPLPHEALHSLPARLIWRDEDVPEVQLIDGLADTPALPTHDASRYGTSPVYHYFREITTDHALDLKLELGPPKENMTLWLNGELVPAKSNNRAGFQLWNGVWTLHLKPGKNNVAIRFVHFPGGIFGTKPIAAEARWSGTWRVFGPSSYQKEAKPCLSGPFPALSLSLETNVATAIFDAGKLGSLTVRMQLMAKSLVVDCLCPSGELEVFIPGNFQKFVNGRIRAVPAMKDNALLLVDTTEQTVFLSLLHDWYRSNASTWTPSTANLGDKATLQGPLCYLPRTDGVRNGVFERYFLTCSPVYEEVLPSIPNPPSRWAAEAGRYVYQESWGPASFEAELAKVHRWVAYGMTNILHLHHEAGWEFQNPNWINDGCTLRLEVSPHKGGNEAMCRFLAAEQALGLRAGLYSNYTDYYPLNSLFYSDRTLLGPDGSRQTAWVHAYKMKPSLAVQFDAWFAPRIARLFHPDTAYTDVHTCSPPWARVDYDERIPGAGTFAASYYSDGEILLNDQNHYHGPVFSEGIFHWMYAGLVSGNYGQIGITVDDPPDPAFNLLKVHPLETDVGVSVGTAGWITGSDQLEAQTDRYLLAVLTYGHIAYLPEMSEASFFPRLTLRVYHMARAASIRYAGQRPISIHYQAQNGSWLTVSQAHARGLDAHCQLRIIYPGNMTVYANWSRTQSWTVDGTTEGCVVLPPNGYFCETPQGVLSSSALSNQARCDRAQTPDGWYVDGRGQAVTWGPLTASGSATLLLDPAKPGFCRLIDGGGNESIRIGHPFAPSLYRAISIEGDILAEGMATQDDQFSIVNMIPQAIRYEWQIPE